jgi:hypothetical protein
MQIILSILLYLNVISSPGTYYLSDINNDVISNQTAVNAVQSDSKLLDSIVNTYKNKVLGISILDDGQMK